MILHLASDTHFTNYAIDYFKAVSDKENIFLIDVVDKEKPLNRIDKSKEGLHVYDRFSDWVDLFMEENLSSIDQVIVYQLSFYRAHLINKYFENIHVTWIFYGSEVYESFKEFRYLSLLPLTKKSLSGFYYITSSKIRNFLRPIYLKIKRPSNVWNFSKRDAFDKIDVFANTDKNGFELISSKLNFRAEWKWFTFYNASDFTKNVSNNASIKNNILIGNSANPFNNHADTFQILKKYEIDTAFDKIIVPLSYGSQQNKKYIKNLGEKMFGNSFNPLLSFMNIHLYNDLIASCKVVVMNNLRPQATGNIITSLLFGSMVFLNEKNPLYRYFNEIGVKIFSVQNDLNALLTDSISISDREIEKNKEIILKIYNEKNILSAVNSLILL